MRTTRPTSTNKYYISKKNGGYSECIRPQDYGALSYFNGSVLANCVAWVNGTWMSMMKSTEYKGLHANAKDMITKAKSMGLEISDVPLERGIMVWSNSTFGHVAIVEKVINSNCIFTSESDYNYCIFRNKIRYNDNKRWGSPKGSTFLGCIKYPKEYDNVLKLVVKKLGLNVRETLSFTNKKASGNKIGFVSVANGNTKEKTPLIVKGFIDGLQVDGYQWVLVDYKGKAGYCQYDSACYTIEEV